MTKLSLFNISLEDNKPIDISKFVVKNLSKLKLYNFDKRYVCDESGNVYKLKKNEENIAVKMNPYITRDGYVEFVLTDAEGKKKHIQSQRIVAGLFLKSCKDKLEVNHKDGNRKNNHVNNLEYVNHSENIYHSWNTLRKKD